MFPSGIIYEFGKTPDRGEVTLHPNFLTKVAYNLLRGVGGGVIGFAVITLLFTFLPVFQSEMNYSVHKKEYSASQNLEKARAEETTKVKEEASSLGLDSYFSIYIPKIDAKAKIIPNVSSVDRQSYEEALSEGVAHAKGTHFPGQGERIYLFSHSTDSPLNFARYNAVFYLLKKLEVGDQITIFFIDQKYVYEVTEVKSVPANDTSYLTGKSDREELVLQTCDPPGTTWRRLLVIAKPVKE